MRRSGFLLPGLGMGLLYCSLNMGLIVINLRGASKAGKDDPAALFHFALVALAALGLSFLIRKGMRRLRPLAALLVATALFCAFIPAMPAELFARIFNGRPPALALSMALLMPVSFFLFFRAVPNGREGLAFALVIVGNELLWSLLFPLFSIIAPQVPDGLAVYLFSLTCWMVGIAGFLLAIAFDRAVRDSAADTAMGLGSCDNGIGQKTYVALCLLFAAGIGIFAITGLHMGMFMPKIALAPEFLSVPYFAFLFLLPLAGRLLDARPGKLMLFCIFGLAGVFCLSLAYEDGLIGRMPLYYPLNIAQQVVLLAFYTATARMVQKKALFPFIIILGYCLHIAHFGGVALRGLVQAMPYGVAAASLALTAGTAWCLWRFRTLLAENPDLWTVPRQENMPSSETEAVAEPSVPHPALCPALHQPQSVAFATAYGLSERESLVMEMLAQGRTTEEIADILAVKPSTVRTYILRLTQKTDTGNRVGLLARYTAHDPMARKTDAD